jgi:hypothetical protein
MAQDPAERLDHYRLVPRESTLRLTGGFAGFNALYQVTGEYDFRRDVPAPDKASFEKADIEGSLISGPAPFDKIDVDVVLNLERLQGRALPVGAPFDVYHFTGYISDDSAVELFASVIGPWMYIRGGTQAPPGSADFFEYEIQALARSGPFADFNENGVVDAADYTLLRDTGWTGGGGVSSGAGFAEWRQQFGETVPDMSEMDGEMSDALARFFAAGAVPEPAGMSLAICGALLLAGLRRWKALRA